MLGEEGPVTISAISAWSPWTSLGSLWTPWNCMQIPCAYAFFCGKGLLGPKGLLLINILKSVCSVSHTEVLYCISSSWQPLFFR